MDKLKAINPEHQPMVNRCTSWLIKHNAANELRNIFDGDEESREYSLLENKCGYTFDKYLDYRDELPKREVANIEASDFY